MFKKLIKMIDPRQRSDDARRSLRNAAYSSADHLLLPILWVISVPIFVSHLGTERYGIWMLVNTIMGLSGVTALGLTAATTKFVSKYRALDDEAGAVRVVRSTLTMYGLLGVATAAVVFSIAPLLVSHVFRVEEQNTVLAIAAIRIGGIAIAVRFLDGVFQSAMFGYERYDLVARVTMLTNSLAMGANVVLVLAGYGLIAVLVNTFGWMVVAACSKAWLAKNKVIKSLVIRPALDGPTVKEILSFGIYSWAQGIGGILFGQADRLLVAALLGTTALSYYAICLQLAQQIHVLLARTVAFVFPLASAIAETGNTDRLRRIYFNGLNFTTVAAIAMGLPLFMCAHGVLSLWMGQPFADETANILRILIFSMCILATSIVPFYFLNGTGYVRLNTLFALVSGSLVAVASFLLIPGLGIAGAAWARTVNIPTDIISRTVLHYRVLSDKRWYGGISTVLPVFVAFAIGTGLLQLMGEPELGLPMLIFRGTGYALLGGALAITSCLLFNSPKRKASEVLDRSPALDASIAPENRHSVPRTHRR